MFGIEAFAMAFPSFRGLMPNPSRIMRITGFWVLKEVPFS
jgi:hypothetical protein